MDGRTVLITGAARGMGQVAAVKLAAMGAHIILVDWEGEAGTRTRDAINQKASAGSAEFRYCDISSLQDVASLAADIRADHSKLDVLINNAGIADPVYRRSVDGHEMHFATCHLGHYALTHGLLALLRNADGARIVIISSEAHKTGAGLDFDDVDNAKLWAGKQVSGRASFAAYHRAKLCNVYMMQELAERLAPDNITVNAVSPGYFIQTTIYRNMTGPSALLAKLLVGLGGVLNLNRAAKGARTHIYLASSPDLAQVTGQYFEHCRPKALGQQADDTAARARLWSLTESITDLRFSVPA